MCLLATSVVCSATSVSGQRLIRDDSSSRHVMADSVGAYRAVGRYLRATYGNEFILDEIVSCASVRQCARERKLGTFATVGRGRRNVLASALRSELGDVSMKRIGLAIPCGRPGDACRVNGASRFVEVKEPVFKGNSGVVVMRVFTNGTGSGAATIAAPSTVRLQLARHGSGQWIVVGQRARK